MTNRHDTNNPKSDNEVVPLPTEEKDNTMAMFIMAGMVVTSAGFAMYTKQTDSLLRRMNSASKIQGTAKTSMKTKTNTKLISKQDRTPKAKTFHEKDDFF